MSDKTHTQSQNIVHIFKKEFIKIQERFKSIRHALGMPFESEVSNSRNRIILGRVEDAVNDLRQTVDDSRDVLNAAVQRCSTSQISVDNLLINACQHELQKLQDQLIIQRANPGMDAVDKLGKHLIADGHGEKFFAALAFAAHFNIIWYNGEDTYKGIILQYHHPVALLKMFPGEDPAPTFVYVKPKDELEIAEPHFYSTFKERFNCAIRADVQSLPFDLNDTSCEKRGFEVSSAE
eukprot:Gregarina_sp_Poly_1__3822@NODE_213_length_11325_cov_357_800853_g189_i0_p3_GENE_NODE_213_length_11325_cov_357_800853_g189_i0NODE_213_length_11325_cov_357_800853_g189_i0_p3_ORF_typecomplete_len236_score40_23CorA/PF01544_18/0_013Ribosomal_S22/PF08136_11/0_17TPR_10/PF13374_6/0_19_NODE_213_length_11325_cov_357_800853_g189_i025283235